MAGPVVRSGGGGPGPVPRPLAGLVFRSVGGTLVPGLGGRGVP